MSLIDTKPEYYLTKYIEAKETIKKLLSFVESIADGDYSDKAGSKFLQKDAADVIEEINRPKV